MPIRPIDMQVAIPRMAEVARMSHLEQQRAGLMQQQNANATEKHQENENQTVYNAQKDARSANDQDAKDKGNNTYYNNRGEVKHKKSGETDSDNPPESEHRIDIRI